MAATASHVLWLRVAADASAPPIFAMGRGWRAGADMWRLSTCGGFVVLAAFTVVVTIIAVGGADRVWGMVAIMLLCLLSVVVGIVAVEDLVLRHRRCPRCEAQGFEALFEGEKETTDGDVFFAVVGCEHCGLRLLECGDEVVELDPDRWEAEMEAWLER